MKTIKMRKPIYFALTHVLANVDPFKEYKAQEIGNGWLKITTTTGRPSYISPEHAKEYFEVLP